MTTAEIDALFGSYREGPLAPSDMLNAFENVFGVEIDLPEYMRGIVTTSDYRIMLEKLKTDYGVPAAQIDLIEISSDIKGNLNVSDLKQLLVKVASDVS